MSKPVQKPDHISQEAWDAVDSPPLTKRMLDNMRPVRESMPPEVFQKLTKGRGPQKEPTKEAVSLRLDRDVVEHFRAMGPGWQTKINQALRETVKAEGKTFGDDDSPMSPEMVELIRAFLKIPDPKLRKKLVELARAVSDEASLPEQPVKSRKARHTQSG